MGLSYGMMGGLAGIGKGLIEHGDFLRKQEEADLEMGRRTKMEMFLLQAREEYTKKAEERAEARKNAPLTRLGEKAREYAAQDVPVEVKPPKRVTGYDPQAAEAGPAMLGFEGDIAEIRRGIAAMPDGPDKEKATAQLQRQIDADTTFESGMMAGKFRKRSPDEALKAAADDAKVNDLPAYAAYEEKIGRAQRDEKKIDLAEQAGARKEAAAERRDQLLLYIADLRHQDSTKRLEALLEKSGRGADGVKEALSFLDGARKELSSEEQTLRQLYQAELNQTEKYDEEGRAAIKAQYEPKLADVASRRKELQADYNDLRTRVGLSARAAPEPTPKPAGPAALSSLPKGAKQIGTSGGKPVYQTPDGKRFIAQ